MNNKQDKIVALSARQMLIKRINIWFGRELGDTDSPFSTQKTIAYREIIDNSIDAIRKTKKNGIIEVTFNEDGSIVCYDSGPGIPTDISKTSDGKPASSVYLALGIMNAGSNYENVTDSLGTNGVGGSGAQLLSEYTKVEIFKDKKKYRLDFKDGEPGIFTGENFKPIKDLTYLEVEKDNRSADEKKKFPTGTRITIKLDDNLFKSKYPFHADDLISRLKGVAFLVPELKIEVINHLKKYEDGSSQREVFHFDDGLKQLLELHTTENLIPIQVLKESGEFTESTVDISNGNAVTTTIKKDIKVELAFTYENKNEYFIDSYVNTIKTRLHGFHVSAFEKAFVQVFNAKLRSQRNGLSKNDEDPIFTDYEDGLCAVVSVNIPEPEFTNQMKEELGGKKAQKEFNKLFVKALDKWVNSSKNQDIVRKIGERVILNAKNRQRLKELQDLKREKAKLERSVSMPTKLVDCEITHNPLSELYIAEGDSAVGALKAARDSSFQAIIPIRGKIKNVLKTTLKDALSNKEVQDIIKCLDAGVGTDFNMEDSRYGKVILATDADVDGGNISCLLLVLFWELFPSLVLSGNLYKMKTPLFIVKHNKDVHYCYDIQEYDTVMTSLRGKKGNVSVTRAKGLGETGAAVLEETGMNPETRVIERVTVTDVEDAKKWIEIAMGNDVEIRRNWIEENPISFEQIGE